MTSPNPSASVIADVTANQTSNPAHSAAHDPAATSAAPAERPRGELFSDPGASVVWAGICALEEGAQHELLIELRERLGDRSDREGPLARKVARGVNALRAAASALDRSPSVRAYRELRNARPDLALPADGSIRSWLGGDWNSALERARLDRVPDSDALLAPLGPKLTRIELLEAVRECAIELDHPPSFQDYLHWARRPDVKKRPGRRSRSQGPFSREFGGWPETLIAAGLINSGETQRGQITRSRVYTDSDLFEFLVLLRERIGSYPSSSQLSSEREEILREHQQAGTSPPSLPSYGVYFQRFKSWSGVRTAFDQWEAEQAAEAEDATATGEAAAEDAASLASPASAGAAATKDDAEAGAAGAARAPAEAGGAAVRAAEAGAAAAGEARAAAEAGGRAAGASAAEVGAA